MKLMFRLSLFLLAISPLKITAQNKAQTDTFVSGDYDELKVSCDSVKKSFTIITDSQEGNFSCALFLSGKMVKNKEGKYPLKAYPYGFDDAPYDGTLVFHEGKYRHHSSIEIKLVESGSCQNIIDFKHGAYFPLGKKFAYIKFSMVTAKKAIVYTDSSVVRKKGYLLKGDFVSVIAENENNCYITYLKTPTFKAWIKKSDLIF